MSTGAEIVQAALDARTIGDATRLQDRIADAVGARYERPLGDRWNNLGLLSRPGSADHKLLELVTNSQDAVLERLALTKFGLDGAVPYDSPHEAATDLLGHLRWPDAAQYVSVELDDSDPPASKTGSLTPIVRDFGCGMAPSYISQSLFFLGTRHKDKAHWQQGAFGVGGASAFRHAQAVILVTRRHPDLLTRDEDDRISVAVCLWEDFEKGSGIYYLTTTDWDSGNQPSAEPWSTPASAYPLFEGGTHLALISYAPERLHTAAWEWSFHRMLNTRLFNSVLPVRVTDRTAKNWHSQNFRGLKRQLAENPRNDRVELAELMPFRIGGTTYQLPVAAYYFEAGRTEAGGKRHFVSSDHAVMFVSNGQCHEHWTPPALRQQTTLKHIYDRLLVTVDLDELPLRARTHLFSPERQGFVDADDTRRLTRQVIEFLDDWDELVELNREVLRKALAGNRNGRPTISIARQIGRALQFRSGFALSGSNGDGGKKRRKKLAKADLYPDPTTIEGVSKIQVEQGQTRYLRFHLNAKDDFCASGRGELSVTCDHPEISASEITVGALHRGFVRVAIAVPETAAVGEYTLIGAVRDWQRATGGLGADLVWLVTLTIIEPRSEEDRRPKKHARGNDDAQSGAGNLVGVVWRGTDDFEDWHASVPGHVEEIEASVLAESDGYHELRALGTRKVPTIFLNRDYAPLKKYEAARGDDLTGRGLDDARDRYAVGAGLGLLLLDRDLKAKGTETPISTATELTAKQAAAQSALVMMPQYDRLAREAGVTD